MIESLYLGDWKESKLNGLIEDFAPYNDHYDKEKFDVGNINIIYAVYTNEYYSGDASVIYESNGKLYGVEGGHCSCYGLEGQWNPQEITLEYLQHKLDNGHFYGYGDYENEKIIDGIIKDQITKYLKERNNDTK